MLLTSSPPASRRLLRVGLSWCLYSSLSAESHLPNADVVVIIEAEITDPANWSWISFHAGCRTTLSVGGQKVWFFLIFLAAVLQEGRREVSC